MKTLVGYLIALIVGVFVGYSLFVGVPSPVIFTGKPFSEKDIKPYPENVFRLTPRETVGFSDKSFVHLDIVSGLEENSYSLVAFTNSPFDTPHNAVLNFDAKGLSQKVEVNRGLVPFSVQVVKDFELLIITLEFNATVFGIDVFVPEREAVTFAVEFSEPLPVYDPTEAIFYPAQVTVNQEDLWAKYLRIALVGANDGSREILYVWNPSFGYTPTEANVINSLVLWEQQEASDGLYAATAKYYYNGLVITLDKSQYLDQPINYRISVTNN